MDQDINNKKRTGEQAMVLLYEKNGVGEALDIELHFVFFVVEYQFESTRFVVNSQQVVNQLSALDVSTTTRIMVNYSLIMILLSFHRSRSNSQF